ncbi:hypothetical protein [Arcobacter roscoffensis]|uniref:Uncharacterized protein n=1 Tax=Arcobacter roscoffensis TaxID=2961520 RepID=A0ABY5E6R4_9BACT|nr:hypothetical protein [Arcobacter roscoffensis]UTJ07849.1 hypothetical protein NJU99_07055 [Arcobacter roscoffensis]
MSDNKILLNSIVEAAISKVKEKKVEDKLNIFENIDTSVEVNANKNELLDTLSTLLQASINNCKNSQNNKINIYVSVYSKEDKKYILIEDNAKSPKNKVFKENNDMFKNISIENTPDGLKCKIEFNN